MKRVCACGTILNSYNDGDACWPCENRARIASLIIHVEPDRPTGNQTGLCRCGCGEKTPIAAKTRASEGIMAGEPVNYLPGHVNKLRGRVNGKSKLTDEIVIGMRREYARGGTSYRKIAEKHGVSEGAVRQAITGRSWSHVPMDEAA
jgi:hypothetical protein